MKKTIKDDIFISIVIVFVSFILQRLFNCFVYQTDAISVLFGIFLLGVCYPLRLFLDKWVITRKLKKEVRKLEKELEELRKKYNE